MQVSVVVCTYTMDRYDVFTEAVESALAQTHEPVEVVLVIDGNPEVYEHAVDDFGDRANVVVHDNNENRGISYSRTKGAELSTGEIVAFIDDDFMLMLGDNVFGGNLGDVANHQQEERADAAFLDDDGIAEPDWIAKHVETYAETNAVAVAGYVAPNWQSEKPDFFPEEFYWLVGCTELGFAEDGEEIRNGYGSNVSYRRDVFLDVGGYDVNTGRKGDRHIQAHEAPVGIRIREAYGKGVVYVEDAVVHHTLFEYRGEFRWLVFRSFWQGFSKRVMEVLYPGAQGNESEFLKDLFVRALPSRVRRAVGERSLDPVQEAIAILVFTGAVGLGYLYGLIRRDVLREEVEESAA